MPTYSKYSPISGGGGTGGITSINADTTAAQLIVGGTGISVATALGTTTITNTSPAPATGNLTEAISTILTITGGTGAVVGSGTTIQVLQAGAAQDGFLSSTDWNTFNNKQPAGTYVTSVTGSAPVSSTGGTTPAISITQSGVATDGYLSSTDWNTFNNKATYPAFSDDQVLYSTTTGAEWRTVGTGSTTAAYPADTVIVGRAKPASLTGVDNILIGTTAGAALTNQTRLIAIGKGALDSMSGTSDPGQIAIGYDALTAVVNPTTGGRLNGAGSHVAIGYRAGVNVTNGRASVYIGDEAGVGVTGGGQNVMVGPFTGSGNASQSIFIGYCAGRGATGIYNSIIGGNLNANVIGAGSSNVGLGMFVFTTNLSTPGGAALTSGSNNTFLGTGTTSLAGTQSNSIALGYQCVTGANEFSVGSSNAQINTMLLGRGGASQTVANAVTIQTMRASGTNTSMTVGTLTLAGAQGTGTGAGGDVIIATAPAGSSGSSLNSHVERVRIDSDGNVGIGNISPSFLLDLEKEGAGLIAPMIATSKYETFTIGVSGPTIYSKSANGTKASPGATKNGDELFSVVVSGYDGSSFQDYDGIKIESSSAWTAGTNSTELRFFTTETSTSKLRLSIQKDGEVQFKGDTSGYVGLSSPAAPTSYSLVLPSAQGAASSVLTNDGSGNLSWNVPVAVETYFGDGSDGSLTVTTNNATSGPLTNGALTRDAYFDDLTISGSGEIFTNGWRLYVRGTLDLTAAGANAINYNGNNGNNATGSTGGTAPTAQGNAAFVGGNTQGRAGVNGGTGVGTSGVAGTGPIAGNSGGAGFGGAGGGGGAGPGGAVGVAPPSPGRAIIRKQTDLLLGVTSFGAITLAGGAVGGSGGSGAGNGGGNTGGGSGSSGNSGGVVYVAAKIIDRGASTAVGAIAAKAGTAGNGGTATSGNSGGGGGAGGSGGGYVYLYYHQLSGTAATNAIDVSGSDGGDAGDGNGSGTGGTGGAGGGGGCVLVLDLSTGLATSTEGTATGSTGTGPTGTTGGTGGAGITTQATL